MVVDAVGAAPVSKVAQHSSRQVRSHEAREPYRAFDVQQPGPLLVVAEFRSGFAVYSSIALTRLGVRFGFL